MILILRKRCYKDIYIYIRACRYYENSYIFVKESVVYTMREFYTIYVICAYNIIYIYIGPKKIRGVVCVS